MVKFEALVKVRDFYDHHELTDEAIEEMLTKKLEDDADVEVHEIVSITRLYGVKA